MVSRERSRRAAIACVLDTQHARGAGAVTSPQAGEGAPHLQDCVLSPDMTQRRTASPQVYVEVVRFAKGHSA